MTILLTFLLLLCELGLLQSQQSYVNNRQLDCERNYTVTEGYVCNGGPPSLCPSYLTFRSDATYNSPADIAFLLNAQPSDIARNNNVTDVHFFPLDTLVIVPVNCSCVGGHYYQYNASYVLKSAEETYFTVANNTYGGLTTCQALIAQNPYNFRDLSVGMRLNIPLRCACPSSDQAEAGFTSLLSYLIAWGDTINDIADSFTGSGVDNRSIFDANELSPENLIFPFTPLLVPLKSEPRLIRTTTSPPPPPPPELQDFPTGESTSSSSHKWLYVGVGVGASVLALVILTIFLVWRHHRRRSLQTKPIAPPPRINKLDESSNYSTVPVSSEGVRYEIDSLTVYKFEDLQKAVGFFAQSNRIKGSVFRGSFDGDYAAVKIMKGDVSSEINLLTRINHSNIIRLSGFCVHYGNTYLVYEYAENRSLSDWLHSKGYQTSATGLGWKQRVQIAYDIADALNYLHNYTNPPHVHKNLKSSNILLDANFRAKVANFGLARTLDSENSMQLTRHVVGTHGYLAPEYIENGLITPKLDVFAFGVVMLELLSGEEPVTGGGRDREGDEELLFASINEVLGDQNVREKLQGFIDPGLGNGYPLDLAYSMAQLAKSCVAQDLNARPTLSEVFVTLSKILSSSLDWDVSDELDHSRSFSNGR